MALATKAKGKSVTSRAASGGTGPLAGKGKGASGAPAPLTLRRWLDDPASVVREAFADGGFVEAAMKAAGRPYSRETAQVEMAMRCAKAMAAGARSEEEARLCNFQQASTGVGKGLAYGVPLMLHAALTEGRCVVATHTVALQRQWIRGEGPLAAHVASMMTGRSPVIALRRSRRHFASPVRLAGQLGLLVEANADEALREAVASLRDWTKAALHRAAALPPDDVGAQVAFAATFDGLVDVWRDENPDLASALDAVDPERYSLTAKCPPDEQAAYKAYAAAAADAQVVVVTMAALVVDLNLHGRVLDPGKKGYDAVVVDEADKLPEVANGVLSTKHSVAGLKSCIDDVLHVNRKSAVDEALSIVCAKAMAAVDSAASSLRLRALGEFRQMEDVALSAGDKAVPLLAAVVDSFGEVLDLIDGLPSHQPAFYEVYENLVTKRDEVATFVKVVRADASERMGMPLVTFSPVRNDPNLVLVMRGERMVLSRLWAGEKARSRSVTFTSATLASPGVRPGDEFREIAEELGLSNRLTSIDHRLNGLHAPLRFGSHAYMLAHPRAPFFGASPLDPASKPTPATLYVAHAVSSAARMPSGRGTCRTLVLTKAFDAAAAIGAAAQALGVANVRARAKGEGLERCLKWFRETPDAVLVTPGAWEGVDLPGLVDHLMIARLPYDPPSASFLRLVGGRPKGMSKMMRRLRQGLGRAVRQRDDAATVWILDPRFGLPEEVRLRHYETTGVLLPAHRKSNPVFLACVETRFRKALDAAELVPLPPGMAFDIQPGDPDQYEGDA